MKAILPGATIGVLGSGQLGRMFAIAARRMGYRVHTYSPEKDTPTGQLADIEWAGRYYDLDRVREFARNVDVVTFEFENVPAETAAVAAEYTHVRPAGSVLHITQNRIREKTFLDKAGIPVTPFTPVDCYDALKRAIDEHGCPAILKTAGFGYDGKGQVFIPRPENLDAAWDAIARCPAVLEKFVDFEREISVVAARGLDGSFAYFPPIAQRAPSPDSGSFGRARINFRPRHESSRGNHKGSTRETGRRGRAMCRVLRYA